MINIVSHRGVDIGKKGCNFESSLESFIFQLKKGFGLEFDLQITKDKEMIISHEDNLFKISSKKMNNKIIDLGLNEILSMDFSGNHFVDLERLMELINKFDKGSIYAVHLKFYNQNRDFLDRLILKLSKNKLNNLIIFDVTLDTAKYLKDKCPELKLAPSVAHQFDIERYNGLVGGTLMSVEKALYNRELFDWVWLDEWDRVSKDGSLKKMYNDDIFGIFKKAGLKIALVSPELHSFMPDCLNGQKHQDADNLEVLKKRICEIINLKPDVICTDYPQMVKELSVN